jgi:hypothetical protein
MRTPRIHATAATVGAVTVLLVASGLTAYAGTRTGTSTAPVLKTVCVAKDATRVLTAPRKGHCPRGTVRRSMPRGLPGAPGPAGAPGPTYSTEPRTKGAPISPGETRTFIAQCMSGVASGGGFTTTNTGTVQILSSSVFSDGTTGFTGWQVTGRNTGTTIEGLASQVMCLIAR